MSNLKIVFSVLLLMFGCLVVSDAQAQFEIVRYSIDGGGGNSSGGDFSVQGTTGQPDAGSESSGGSFSVTGGVQQETVLLGDVNNDGNVDLLDVAPFVAAIAESTFIVEADINQDGLVNLLDVEPFVNLLSGG